MNMGHPHPCVQLTGAVCLGAATCLKGTVAYRSSRRSSRNNSAYRLGGDGGKICGDHPESSCERKKVYIGHRSGEIPVEVHLQRRERIERYSVSRTARKLF